MSTKKYIRTAPKSKPAVKSSASLKPIETVRADQTAAFLREVDEAMRLERWQNFWQKGKLPMLGGLALVIAATAAWQGLKGWQAYTDRSTATRWAELAELPNEADLAAALPAFVTESAYGYKALGLLAQAKQNPTPEAKLQAYRVLQNDTMLPDWLRALGQLNAALVQLPTNPVAARADLDLLAKTELGVTPLPTTALALELLALDAMQRNNPNDAKAYTQRLLQLPEMGTQLTPTLRERALARLGALGGV